MKSMGSNIRVGIAGYGVVGQRRKACIERHPGMEVVAVCDRKFLSTGALDDGVFCFSNYNDLLDEPIDALFVCLTNEIAAEVTISGLKKGLHVFCEKPPGRHVEDIRNVMRVEKLNPKLKLMYGFNHRHHDSVKDAT